jgi:hypothetical protein
MVVVAFLAASLWYFWRSLRREGSSPKLTVLHSMRLLAALMVAITLLKPERVLTLRRTEKPRVAVLWDASGSMATQDVVNAMNTAETRQSWLKAKLDHNFWKPLESRYAVSVLPFSAPGENDAATAGTDLYTPLESAAEQFSDLRAVLMLTDADWNTAPANKSPATAATHLLGRQVPIYGVTIGAESFLPDLEITTVLAPTYALLNERVSVVATLQNRINREVKTTLSISDAKGQLTHKAVILPPMGQAQEMLVLQPKEEGDMEYKVTVPVETEDLFPTNNEKSFRMAVRKETLKVLVVDSAPRWEYRYLRNALLRDPGVNLNTVLYHPELGMGEGNGYLAEFPQKAEDLQSYDVIFLGDVGLNGQLSKENCEMIRGLVEQQASGVVFLPGSRGNQRTLVDTALAELIPVELDYGKSTGNASKVESRLELTMQGKDHWLTMLATDPAANAAVWKGLPGFNWYAPVLRARSGSSVLAVHEVARGPNGRTPLLVTRPFGNGNVLFMGTDAAWRWRKGVEDTYHYRFWGQVVRWMSHQRHLAQDEGIRLIYAPESPKRGDKMRLTASVFDKLGQPVKGEKVTVRLTAPSGAVETVELSMENQTWGAHAGEFQPKEGGVYSANVATAISGRKLDRKFEVSIPALEKVGRPAKPDVLRELSNITRGITGGTADLERIINAISVLPEPKSEERRFQLWCSGWWVASLLALLTTYWVGRKVAGLA